MKLNTDQENRLSNLTKLDIALGSIIALITIFCTIGTWLVLPYRVTELEKQQIIIKAELAVINQVNARDRELLIRMDERLRTLQRALKIPVSDE